MQKLVKKVSTSKSTANSYSFANTEVNPKAPKPKAVNGKKLYAVRDAKGRFIDIVAEKATAREIRKALGIKPENTKRIRQIMRDLESKNWPID